MTSCSVNRGFAGACGGAACCGVAETVVNVAADKHKMKSKLDERTCFLRRSQVEMNLYLNEARAKYINPRQTRETGAPGE
jgi:hypothetical protein